MVHADSPVGVALLFDSWRFPSDGALGRPGFPRVQPAQLPDEGSLQAAADGVRQQADHVRALKQQQGLGNQVGRVLGSLILELELLCCSLCRCTSV
jgi:hypothetical protein